MISCQNDTVAEIIAKLPVALRETANLQRDYREAKIVERSARSAAWQRENPKRAKASSDQLSTWQATP